MKKFLLINTAAEPCQVALATARRVEAESQVADRHRLSEQLLARIDELSGRSKLPLEKLAAIGIVTGPGPFTALRIGVAVTNALAYAHKLPIVSAKLDEAPSLLALAKLTAERLESRQTSEAVLPHYGREPTITPRRAASAPGRRKRSPGRTGPRPDSGRRNKAR
jgi:tRNA threonylcarbamoyladenosine biosynthesis protein TsaB